MTDTQFKIIDGRLDDLKKLRLEDRVQLEAMRAEIKPVIELFATVKRVGKWAAVLVAFFGSLTALALGVKELFKK
jgi:hypothetical protein